MLVRHQRALAGYVGGIILAAAIVYGGLNLENMMAIIFSFLGVVIAIIAGWYAFRR